MSSLVTYESRIADIPYDHGIAKIQYIRCSPPAQLLPKGTVVLLHDFLRTSYQFRYVIDLFAMCGYITIVPDILNTRTWRNNMFPDSRSSALSTAAIRIGELLGMIYPNTSVHLVGCGLGARLAEEIATARADSIQSLTCTSADSILKKAARLTDPNVSLHRSNLRAALEIDFKSHGQPHELMSAHDLKEYVDAYSDFETLSDMQQLAQEIATQASPRRQPRSQIPQCFVQSDPEIEPEEWALSIIATLNLMSKPKSIKQARL